MSKKILTSILCEPAKRTYWLIFWWARRSAEQESLLTYILSPSLRITNYYFMAGGVMGKDLLTCISEPSRRRQNKLTNYWRIGATGFVY